MSLNYNNIKNSVTVILAASVILVSCVQMSDTPGDDMGYLSYSALAVDLKVDEQVATKAVTLPEIYEPVASEVTFKVTDCNGKVHYEGIGPWTEALSLPVGAYTVEASYGSNSFATPGFYGKVEGTISATVPQNVAVGVSLVNSLVAVSLSEDMKQHFILGENPVVSLVAGPASHTVNFGEYCFVPSEIDLKVKLTGTNSTGQPAEFTYTLAKPAARTAYEVICAKATTNWPSIALPAAIELAKGAFEGRLYFSAAVPTNMSDENAATLVYHIKGGKYTDWTEVEPATTGDYKYITGLENGCSYTLRACVGKIISNEEAFSPVSFQSCIEPSFSAVHQYPDGLLSGTAVTAGVSVDLPDLIQTLSTGLSADATFVNAKGEDRIMPVASTALAKDGTSTSLKMNPVEGWPYIPHGSHKLTVNAECILPDGTVKAKAEVTGDVPEPSFSLTLKAYTSYDKAIGRNASAGIEAIAKEVSVANGLTAETLYDAGASWTISPVLMQNSNYSKMLKINLDGAEISSPTALSVNSWYTNVKDLSWASHTLQASFTFADKTVTSATQTLHITGLPYNAAPPTEGDWKKNDDVSFKDSFVRFGNGKSSNGGSITFDKFNLPTDVNVLVSAKIDAYGAPINTTTYVEVSGVQILTCTSDSGLFNYKTSTLEASADATLKSANKSVKAGSTYGLGDTNGKLYYLNIKYR